MFVGGVRGGNPLNRGVLHAPLKKGRFNTSAFQLSAATKSKELLSYLGWAAAAPRSAS